MNMRVLLFGLLISACWSTEREGDEPSECSDDADQDADGLFDCDDPDCAGAAVCSGSDADTDSDTDSDTDTDTDTDTDSGAVTNYTGSTTGDALAPGGEEARCSGAFSLRIDWEAGTVTGNADCQLEGYEVGADGAIRGTVAGGIVHADWTGAWLGSGDDLAVFVGGTADEYSVVLNGAEGGIDAEMRGAAER